MLNNLQMLIDWKTDFKGAFRSQNALFEFLELKKSEVETNFPVLVTRHYAGLMKKGDIMDPLLLQVLPTEFENQQALGFSIDPVGDSLAQVDKGLLKKYHGRVLIMPTAACAVHCRHCFRRNFPYAGLESTGFANRFAQYLGQNSDIEEILFSGGDPFMLDNQSLKGLLELIEGHKSILRVRFHTRLPVVLPSRFDEELLNILSHIKQEKILVVHANHANELDENSNHVFAKLRAIGFTLLNQSVLLKSVNDSAITLADLSKKLHQQGVLPYYLHQLDRALGTAHFEVTIDEGKEIMKELEAILPGYLVPKYVQEIAGQQSKTRI